MKKTIFLDAVLTDGKVYVDGHEIVGATIGSSGAADSTGVLFLYGEKATYFANTVSDLSTTLEKLSESLGEIAGALGDAADALTAIGGGMTGPTTAPPPTLPLKVTAIMTAKTSIESIASEIDTLRGDLK